MVIISLPIPGTDQHADVSLDATDYARLTAENWRFCLAPNQGRLYVVAHRTHQGCRQRAYLHRLILGTPQGNPLHTHHLNQSDPLTTLNNCRENLLPLTNSAHRRLHHQHRREATTDATISIIIGQP
ncbi:MAG: hypothetical protein AB7T17_01925 [Geobacter sp.]